MQEVIELVSMLQPFSFIVFIVAFVSMVVANRYTSKANFGPARIWTMVSAIAASLVLLFDVALFALTFSPFAGVMVLVWGYFSYVSWKRWSDLSDME